MLFGGTTSGIDAFCGQFAILDGILPNMVSFCGDFDAQRCIWWILQRTRADLKCFGNLSGTFREDCHLDLFDKVEFADDVLRHNAFLSKVAAC